MGNLYHAGSVAGDLLGGIGGPSQVPTDAGGGRGGSPSPSAYVPAWPRPGPRPGGASPGATPGATATGLDGDSGQHRFVGGPASDLGLPSDFRRGQHLPEAGVPDVAGRDIARHTADPTREQLRERLSRIASGPDEFETVVFEAFVKGARVITGGEVEITLSVPKEMKYAAIPITDAAGFMVRITAEKVDRG